MKKSKKERRKEMLKYRIKQSQGFIQFHRELLKNLKRELDFINGHYDKTWEEEYPVESSLNNNIPRLRPNFEIGSLARRNLK